MPKESIEEVIAVTGSPVTTREATHRLRVHRRTELCDGVVELELIAADGSQLPSWAAGAHIDLLLGDGLERQYSLCGDSNDTETWRIAVLLAIAGRGGSEFVHRELREGATVAARGPRNHFELVRAPAYLFIAGGIGITPIIAMIADAEGLRVPWRLIYGGRTATSMAYAGMLRQKYGDRVLLCPQDETGLLKLDKILDKPCPGTLIYCCGPEPLLLAVEHRCTTLPSGTLHTERFAPRSLDPSTVDEAFEVELVRSNLRIYVPAGKSLLEVADEAGVNVLSSCEEGICGTCETEVLSGSVDHRDSFLTDEERSAMNKMMICVSRAAGPGLQLEL